MVFGGRNKPISEPFGELRDSLDVVVNKKGEELRKMISLEGDYRRGYIEVITREAGHLCDKV